jgi:hypothetical protein
MFFTRGPLDGEAAKPKRFWGSTSDVLLAGRSPSNPWVVPVSQHTDQKIKGEVMNKHSFRVIANTHGKTASRILAVLFAVSTLGHAQQPAQKDNFDFWLLKQQYGTITLSPDQNHTPGGTQSLKFASSSGGQREMHATHSFKSHTNGNFTVWFYDVAPGQETLYEQLSLRDSVSGWSASMGTEDFDANCYMTQLYNSNTQQKLGPNANCGIYPQTTTTPITRTVGWHKLYIQVGKTDITFSIDGTVVFTYVGHVCIRFG